MRSPFGALRSRPRNDSPVPLAPTRGGWATGTAAGRDDSEAQMAAMGSNGTLFTIAGMAAADSAAVPWRLYRRSPTGNPADRVEVTQHAALDLWNKPNPHMTGMGFRETKQQHVELVGESCWVVARSNLATIPLELWPVRPDKLTPVPSATKFLAGWIYRTPDGDKIPLGVDDVIQEKMPNPLDPYRGLGPVQAVLTAIDSVKYSRMWNRNFFMNDASPGGVIEFAESLDDVEFDTFTKRWRESHQGIGNAHRVAVIEGGKWVERSFNQRDMQFAQLAEVSREDIREAFGFPKPMTGAVDNINRSNADAAEIVYGRWFLTRRLRRTRDVLNWRLLPMYYPGQQVPLEFDYDSPVTDLPEDLNAALAAKVAAAVALVDAGWDPDEVCDFVGIPRMTFAAPVPAAPAGFGGQQQGPPNPPIPRTTGGHAHHHKLAAGSPRVVGRVDMSGRPGRIVAVEIPEWGPPRLLDAKGDDVRKQHLEQIQKDWEKQLDDALDDWTDITDDQREEIREQIETAVDKDDMKALAAIDVSTAEGQKVLHDHMKAMWSKAAKRVEDEAADQGVDVDGADIDDDADTMLSDHASAISDRIGQALAATAVKKAIQINAPGSTGKDVADGVDDYIGDLSGAGTKSSLGGGLSNAQNSARIATMKAGPEAAFYADETNDANTCEPCSDVDGKWLGNDTDEAENTYPNGGYVDCEGGDRCRGTVIAIWRGGDDPDEWVEGEEPGPSAF